MDNRADIREFLATRRAKISPEQAGLPAGGGRRRVPGLRREEVAVLAGVSTEWYTRLEKGHITGVSDDVLDAVARALQLNEAERTYLYDLARAAAPHAATDTPAPPRRGPATGAVDARLDDRPRPRSSATAAWTSWPPTRSAGRCTGHDTQVRTATRGRRTSPASSSSTRAREDFFPDWDGAANVTVALLRAEAGRDPHNKDLRDLVGELSTLSDEFRARWAAHDVRIHRAGKKQFHHPEVGDLDLVYHSVNLAADEDYILDMTIYTAEPGLGLRGTSEGPGELGGDGPPHGARHPAAALTGRRLAHRPAAPTPHRPRIAHALQEIALHMQITRSSLHTAKGPADWFTGDVYIDAVAAAPAPSRVHRQPRALHARRPHSLAPAPIGADGVRHRGRRPVPAAGRPGRGDPPRRPRPVRGRRGALARRRADRLMVHLAINEGDPDHAVVNWLDPVTDEEYAAAPDLTGQ